MKTNKIEKKYPLLWQIAEKLGIPSKKFVEEIKDVVQEMDSDGFFDHDHSESGRGDPD